MHEDLPLAVAFLGERHDHFAERRDSLGWSMLQCRSQCGSDASADESVLCCRITSKLLEGTRDTNFRVKP